MGYEIYLGTNTPLSLMSICSTTNYSPGNLSHGTFYYWQVKAVDNHAASTQGDVWQFGTLPNTPPTASSLNILPSSPKTFDDLTGTYTYSDVDKDTDTGSQVMWFCNDSHLGIYDGTLTIPASATARGQTWLFTIRPGDGEGFRQTGTSSMVTIGNTSPVADAGLDQTVLVNTPVTLNGSNSLDEDHDILSYHWEQVSGPKDVDLSVRTGTQSIFIPTIAGDYSFSLTVNDGTADSSTDMVKITVAIGPDGGVWRGDNNAGQAVFPAGAVLGTETMGIKLEDDIPPGTFTGVANVIRVPGTIREFSMTSGVNLNKPITIQIPYAATNGCNEDRLQIYRLEDSQWRLVEGGMNHVDKANKVVIAEISHLSIFCIAENKGLPEECVVFVYPNPAKDKARTTFRWYLHENYPVTISIYDLDGDLVTTLEGCGRSDGAYYEKDWDLQDVASGVYIYVFVGGGKQVVDKVMVVK